MEQIKVSIIVPIYNVEKYLDHCLNTLVNQTLKEIELILVNDGTKDNSMEIVKRYEKEYDNIVVINKENGGLSSARNAGLEVARGEYVSFIDSDDFVKTTMMDRLYKKAKETDSDMVISGFYRYIDHNECIENLPCIEDSIVEGHDIISKVVLPMCGELPESKKDISMNVCVWKNIYRRSLFDEHHIRFKSEREVLSEDIIFHLDFILYMKRIAIIHEAFYYYVYNTSSLSNGALLAMRQPDLYYAMKESLEKWNLWDKGKICVKKQMIGRIRHDLNRVVQYNKGMGKCLKYMREILDNPDIQEIFEEYPISRMHIKQKIPTFCMKHRLILCCYFIFSTHKVL